MEMTTENENNEIEIQDLSVVRDDAVRKAEEAVERAFGNGNVLLNALDSESEDFVRYADTGMGLISASVGTRGMDQELASEDFLRLIDSRILLENPKDDCPPYTAAVAGAVFEDGGYAEYNRWFDGTLSNWMEQVAAIPEDFWNIVDATTERYAEKPAEGSRQNCLRKFKGDFDKAIEPVGNFLKEKLTKGGLFLLRSASQVNLEQAKFISHHLPKKIAPVAAIGLVVVPVFLKNYKGGKFTHA